MKPTTHRWLALFFVVCALAACDSEHATDCQTYCGQEQKCALASGSMYSESECRRSCTEEFERYASIGCGESYGLYLGCMSRLVCSDWAKQALLCDDSIQSLQSCVGAKN